jgi:ATP-dependent helicase/nuclease subunit B
LNSSLDIDSAKPFLPALARHILAACPPPDLSRVHVWLPNAQAVRQLRRALHEQSQSALIGPYIGSLSQWLNDRVPLPADDVRIMTQASRQLLLFDALRQHRQLFQENNLWQVCDSLLQLFDELSRHQIRLLDVSIEDWQILLQDAYGMRGQAPHYLQHEARMVHTLWQAWHQQTRALNMMDAVTATQLRLQCARDAITADDQFYVVGFEQLAPAEQQWCIQLSERGQLTRVNQVADDSDAYSHFLQLAYDTSQSLQQRAKNARDIHVASLREKLSTYAAADHEDQARAIDMQIRLWLSQGVEHIAMVSEDRKLGRRVRALLERSGVMMEDTAGWPLSTTSAAACLERWLECIEEDFSWLALLDLLKSPFFCADSEREAHLAQVFRFEQDVVIYERITSDLQRYKIALRQRRARLTHWQGETFDALNRMLDGLQNAAKELRELYRASRTRAVSVYIEALHTSLEKLNIHAHFAEDIAGQRLLQTLAALLHASRNIASVMSWQDFRTWLGDALEQQEFKPQTHAAAVQLMNLKQAQYCRFDALIIAGANAGSLPGKPAQTAFFNHAVRQHLGMQSWREQKADAFARFRFMLQSADRILISYTREHHDEWLQPSPWVTSLADLAKIAVNADLQNDQLRQYLYLDDQQRSRTETSVTVTSQPQPALVEALRPEKYSVSAYQRLMDCPYKFFASDGLALKAEDRITRELMKSEYGEQVHEILCAFSKDVPGLPRPFAENVTAENYEQALAHLNTIATAVFARDSDDSVQRADWLHNWSLTAPQYIEWLMQRQQDWQFHQAEEKSSVHIDDDTELHGRLDRIEKQSGAFAIIDYKTGASPDKKIVQAGEDVQLLSYASLMQDVKQVAYLGVSAKGVGFDAVLDEDQLQTLRPQNVQRLRDVSAAIRQGSALPAWGDAKACEYCSMKGLCRKQIWEQGS